MHIVYGFFTKPRSTNKQKYTWNQLVMHFRMLVSNRGHVVTDCSWFLLSHIAFVTNLKKTTSIKVLVFVILTICTYNMFCLYGKVLPYFIAHTGTSLLPWIQFWLYNIILSSTLRGLMLQHFVFSQRLFVFSCLASRQYASIFSLSLYKQVFRLVCQLCFLKRLFCFLEMFVAIYKSANAKINNFPS